MAGINKAFITGFLGKDPDFRTSEGGRQYCDLLVATDFEYRDSLTGEMDRATEWHDVLVKGGQAEGCRDWLSKGDKVTVEGYLRTKSWISRHDGIKRRRTQVIAERVEFWNIKRG